jgi:chemotaxis protein histidine kinase CheA
MGAVEHWGRTEAVPVNAGRLYEMINDVAALRQEAHSALGRVGGDGAEVSDAIARLQARADDLQSESLGLAAVPLTGLTSQLPQLIAYLAKKLNRGVAFEIYGDEGIAVDRQVLDAIGDPLRQLIVNAVHHGIEPRDDRSNAGKPDDGTITVQFSLRRGTLEIVVSDDGAGVDWDRVRNVAAAEGRLEPEELADPVRLHELLFETGFTTGSDPQFGGGGKGLSTVETIVESLFGKVTLETEPGTGTRVAVTVPAFRALQSVLLVIAGGMEWGIPSAAVDEVVPLAELEVEGGGKKRWITRNDRQVPVAAFAEVVGLEEGRRDGAYAVIVDHLLGSAAFTVSSVTGTRELAVKEMGRIVSGPRHILGAAFLAGDMMLVVDPGRLVERTQREPVQDRPSARVMVVDDSRGARAVVSGALASSGFLTSVAGSVAEALDLLNEAPVDALVVDFSMPQADGVELVEEVRRRGILVPIIMLSGVANHEDQERARRAGADAFFEKADFREGALADALWKMLDD